MKGHMDQLIHAPWCPSPTMCLCYPMLPEPPKQETNEPDEPPVVWVDLGGEG